MIPTLLLAAILSVSDPAGDAIGNGSLEPPTAVVYRTPGVFDAQKFEVLDTPDFGFSLTMGQLNNPWNLPNGFSLPVIEIYLDTHEGGSATLLPGSGMMLPESSSWRYAFKLTGDNFQMLSAEPGSESYVDVTEAFGASLKVEGNTLTVTTDLARPDEFSIYGMVGGYDPFTDYGWRPVQTAASPWAFSSESQTVRVVDVIADKFSQQRTAISSGVLPEIRAATHSNSWLLVTAAGLLVSLVGVIGRFTVKAPASPAATTKTPTEETEAEAAPKPVPLAPLRVEARDAADPYLPKVLIAASTPAVSLQHRTVNDDISDGSDKLPGETPESVTAKPTPQVSWASWNEDELFEDAAAGELLLDEFDLAEFDAGENEPSSDESASEDGLAELAEEKHEDARAVTNHAETTEDKATHNADVKQP